MTFEFIPTDDGLRIHDQIENVWTDIHTGGAVEPEPASTDVFRVPLDAAVRFEAERLEFSTVFLTRVFDSNHRLRAVVREEYDAAPDEVYEIDCAPSGMKAYVRVHDTGLEIDSDQTTTLTFDHSTPLVLGVRSLHERPAGVVTTSSAPTDLMHAISTFGSAMKTFSPERSFPTLRGHPPELAVKSSLQIPPSLSAPDTGIEIEVPPNLEAIFTVAPLAYYLGATVTPGSESAIHTAGTTISLDDSGLPNGVLQTLKQCFTLDCLVRTAGLYPVELRELETVRARVDLDPDTLYGLPVDERTAAYLSMPADAVTDILSWPTITDVNPRPQNAELLPYLVYGLSAIRSPPRGTTRTVEPNQPVHSAPNPSDSHEQNPSISTVTPKGEDTHHSCWVGDSAPRSGCVPILASYISALDETPRTGEIDVQVVCTDDGMLPEIDALYTGRTGQPIDVIVSCNVTTSELESILRSGADFIHFVGHSTRHGLRCTDGVLDLRTLPHDRYPAFFINGCQSFHQGRALAEKGSVGGLVSLEELPNDDAISAGRTIATLLAYGCSFNQILSVVSHWSPLEYTGIGDGDYRIVAPSDYTPLLAEFHQDETDRAEYPVTIRPIGETGNELGSLVSPAYDDEPLYLLHAEYTTRLSLDTLQRTTDGAMPIIVDGDFHWSSELDNTQLRNLLQNNSS